MALRFALGVIFIVHGYPKLFKDFSGAVQFFGAVGITSSKFLVFIVGAVEFFGGILLLAGAFVQLASVLLALDVLSAIWKAGFKKGFTGGYEFELALFAMLVSLLVLGPGAFSLDLPL